MARWHLRTNNMGMQVIEAAEEDGSWVPVGRTRHDLKAIVTKHNQEVAELQRRMESVGPGVDTAGRVCDTVGGRGKTAPKNPY